MDDDQAPAAIGAAIRDALDETGRTQAWLGAEIAAMEGRADPFSQAIVSDWLIGKSGIPPHRLFRIEKALGLKAGQLSRIAGYVPASSRPSGPTVVEAIAADQLLTDPQREMLLAAYETARAQTRARRLKRSK